MKRTMIVLLGALLLAAALAPQAALATVAVRTTGKMTVRGAEYLPYSAGMKYVHTWVAVKETDGDVRGRFTLTMYLRGADGTYDFVSAESWPVRSVRRLSRRVVQFSAPGARGWASDGPNSWGTGRWRTIDRGSSGDGIRQYCQVHERWEDVPNDYLRVVVR